MKIPGRLSEAYSPIWGELFGIAVVDEVLKPSSI
jgi:hypothetical protein